MSKILFDKSYVIVIPSYNYTETQIHSHSMLHLFWGSNLEIRSNEMNISGDIICVNSGVVHECLRGDTYGLLLIDPASKLADMIANMYFVDKGIVGFSKQLKLIRLEEKTEAEVFSYVEDLLVELRLSDKNNEQLDPEMESLVSKIKEYQFIGKRVTDVASSMHYSESYLSHTFKEKVGCSLKNYLMICQFEYVWKAVIRGKSITEAAMEAGYSSPSHFSSTCKQMTGTSITQVSPLIITADF